MTLTLRVRRGISDNIIRQTWKCEFLDCIKIEIFNENINLALFGTPLRVVGVVLPT